MSSNWLHSHNICPSFLDSLCGEDVHYHKDIMSDRLQEVKKNISAVGSFFLSRWDKYVCACQERITGVIKGGEEYDKIKTSPLLTEPVLANIRSPDAHK